MTITTALERPSNPKETISFTAFEFADLSPSLALRSAAFPSRWLRILREQWHVDPAHRGKNLPTYALIELIASLDVHIVAVARDLADAHWLRAYCDVDSEVLRVAVAAWASTEVTPRHLEIDWEAMLADDEFDWQPETVNLAEWGTRLNGTADVATHCYQVLPGYLAGLVVDHGITIQEKAREFILGPLQPDGVRSAVSWPPEQMPDPTGNALWSYKITFQLKTIPARPTPLVLADLSVVRYTYLPLRYVPRTPRRGKSVKLWMYASKGFLRSTERPTLVEATAKRRKIDGDWRWHWDAGLSRALAGLTTRRVPDPDSAIMQPNAASPREDDSGIVALAVYQNGMMMQRPEEPAKSNTKPRSKSVRHPAMTGFQPIDHMQVHQELEQLFTRAGLVSPPSLTPYKSKQVDRKLPRHQPRDAHYELELWTQNSATREAVLTAISHESGLGLTPIDSPTPETFQFGGDYTLTVAARSIGRLASGIEAPTAADSDTTVKDAERRRARDQRVAEIVTTLPPQTTPTAAVVEIDTPDFFSRLDLLDPKNQIKAGFAIAQRTPNCLHPIETRQHPDEDEEAANNNQSAKAKKRAKVADGTQFKVGDLKRAAAAVLDSLRQAGRTTLLPEPPGITGPCELIGVWLEQHGGAQIPIIIRLTTDGEIRAQLFGAAGVRDLPYSELPAALVAGEGRLSRNYVESRQQLVDVLVGAIDPGATHDRVLFVRSANLRNRGWAWLQDQHITPQRLHLPGVDPTDTEVDALTPSDIPGLRVVRLRERSASSEVPRAFVRYTTTDDEGNETEKYARASGLFPLNDIVYYGIAPRADQQQTPLEATKLDPDRPGAARTLGWNPNPLEIIPAFVQDNDQPAELAAYVNHLRRAYLHTTIATQMPLPLHLASLADEYLKCLG